MEINDPYTVFQNCEECYEFRTALLYAGYRVSPVIWDIIRCWMEGISINGTLLKKIKEPFILLKIW